MKDPEEINDNSELDDYGLTEEEWEQEEREIHAEMMDWFSGKGRL